MGKVLLALAGLTRDGRDFDYLARHLPDVRLIRLDSHGRAARTGRTPKPIRWRKRRATRWRCWII